MQVVDRLDVVYDDYFPENPTEEEMEQVLYDANNWLTKASENQRVILTFEEIELWFKTWDQSNQPQKYDNVYDYIRASIGNGLEAVISTEAIVYASELVLNVTDADPLADITEEDAMSFIEAAQEEGYSIPEILTPKFFVDIYMDLKVDAEDE